MPEPESKALLITQADFVESPVRPKPNVPDHELIRRIGAGAYGEVWLARSVIGTYRAVKVVYRNSFQDDRPYEREYRGIQKFEPLSRTNDSLVDILQIGRNDEQGYFYYVMELADDADCSAAAEVTRHTSMATNDQSLLTSAPTWTEYAPKTLRTEIKRCGRLPFEECLQFALSLNLALGHLHRHGLIHRDIKPSNIIFVGGVPKLADIGLVTDLQEARSFVGTEGFIPPEGPNSPQADIYSLGKVLYEMSMGKDRTEFPEPFTALGQATGSQELEELNTIILKACAANPRERYRSAEEMHVDLALLQDGKSVKSKRILERRLGFARKAGTVVGAVAAIAVMAFLYQQFQTREARRLAKENRELASSEGAARTRAEGLLTTLQFKRAENFFENDDASRGVAYLARMVRQNPSNQIAASRLMSALTDRSFALPVRVFTNNETELQGVEFSPDGRRILFWAGHVNSGTAGIWDVRTGGIIGKLMRHDESVRKARFSPDGQHIVTLGWNGSVRLWNSASGEPVGAPLIDTASSAGKSLPIRCFAFSPDSAMLATGKEGESGEARFWRVPTGEPALQTIAHKDLSGIEFSPDGQRILISGGHAPEILDLQSGNREVAIDHPAGWAIFSPDGNQVFSFGGPYTYLWDAHTGQQLRAWRHDNLIGGGCFSPDGLRVLTRDAQQSVRIWDAESGQSLIPPLSHKTDCMVQKFDLTGERLLTCEWGRARVWDSRTGEPLTERMYGPDLNKAQFSPDGLQVLAMTKENTAVLWDVRPGQALNVVLPHRSLVPSAKFSPDGRRVVTAEGGSIRDRSASDARNEAYIWDVETGERLATLKHPDRVRYAEFSPDGRWIATACVDQGEARIWDAQTGAPLTPALRHAERVRSVRFSTDGQKVVTASKDKTARVWDAHSGEPLTAPLMHSNQVYSAQFSPDGQWILTSAEKKTARIWNAKTGNLTAEFVHDIDLTDAQFSPDGNHIMTSGTDGTVRIWDRATGRAIGEPWKHQSYVWSARFSRDGQYAVTTPEIEGARIWNTFSGRTIGEPLLHQTAVAFAQFSPDGQRVMTAASAVRVWDVQTSRPMTELLHQLDRIPYAEFSPDGTRIVAVGTHDELPRIWELPIVPLPVPAWVPDLADAIAGQRLTNEEVGEPVSASRFLELKQQVIAMAQTNHYTAWARWLLADRLTRTTSLRSCVTAATHVERLIAHASHRTVRDAVRFSPNDAVAIASLAREILHHDIKDQPLRDKEAEFFSKRAVEIGPNESEAWRTRADVLEATDRLEEALQAIDRAIALKPGKAHLWTRKGEWLEKRFRNEEALEAFSSAVRIAGTNSANAARDLKIALLGRGKILKRLGREQEAIVENLRAHGIPLRDSAAGSEQIDLSPFYNAGLKESWHGGTGHDLASVPSGIQSLGGVRWDVRGLVQVGGDDEAGKPFPKRISAMPVGFACKRVHFLHAANFGVGFEGTEIGKYVVHFSDGREIEIPIVVGRDLADWWNQPNEEGKSFAIAWTGTNADSVAQGRTIRLFKMTWENPLPKAAITSIDLVSTHERAAPFVLAITAESTATREVTRR